METVTIDKGAALTAYKKASGELKGVLGILFGDQLVNCNPMDIFKSYADVCEAEGIDALKSLPFQNPKTKKEVSTNGAFKLETIFEAFNKRCGDEFNEQFEPDYANPRQEKWYPWHEWVPSRSAFVYTGTFFSFTNTRASVPAFISRTGTRLADLQSSTLI